VRCMGGGVGMMEDLFLIKQSLLSSVRFELVSSCWCDLENMICKMIACHMVLMEIPV